MWTGTKQELADMCRQMAASMLDFKVPNVDMAQLMWALAGNESSFGVNLTPRHEPAYDVGGVYGQGLVMGPLLAKWGSRAACSYGPWQLMFCNAPRDASPFDFDSLLQCAQMTAAFMNELDNRHCISTIAEMGECWNGGHVWMQPQIVPPAVAAYVQRLTANYQVPILAAGAGATNGQA